MKPEGIIEGHAYTNEEASGVLWVQDLDPPTVLFSVGTQGKGFGIRCRIEDFARWAHHEVPND